MNDTAAVMEIRRRCLEASTITQGMLVDLQKLYEDVAEEQARSPPLLPRDLLVLGRRLAAWRLLARKSLTRPARAHSRAPSAAAEAPRRGHDAAEGGAHGIRSEQHRRRRRGRRIRGVAGQQADPNG